MAALFPRHIQLHTLDETNFLAVTPQNYKFMQEMPEKKKLDGFGRFKVAATDTSVAQILTHCTPDTITFADDLAKVTFQSIALRTKMSEQIREQTAIYKETKVLPHLAEQLTFDPRLAGYQKLAACNGYLADGYGEFMEQGTGKTFAAIGIIDNLKTDYIPKILVVAPNNVRLNWSKEIQKFSTKICKTVVVRGTQMARISRLVECFKKTGQEVSVAVLGYDLIAGMWDALQMIEWDIVILDESHYIRNSATKRWKYVKRLREKAKKRLCLTGTPIANSIMDLYTQLEFMGEGYSGFTSFKAFKSFFGVYERENAKSGGGQYERLLALQNVPIMQDRLSRYAFIITKKEALPDLPDKLYDIDEIEMPEAQADAYDRLAKDLVYEIESELNNSTQNQAMVINNVLTMLLKLAQITSGFLNVAAEYGPEGEVIHAKKTIQFAPNPKTERMIEIITEKREAEPNSKTIVWACFTHDIEHLARACAANGIKAVTFYGQTSDADRVEAERAFNFDADCKVFIGNPAAGGTGLNLLGYPPGFPDQAVTNADHVVYYSQDWSSLKRSQSEDRAHRRGTRHPVRITDLCVPGTIDETIRARVVEKRMNALEITDVRSILREIVNRE